MLRMACAYWFVAAALSGCGGAPPESPLAGDWIHHGDDGEIRMTVAGQERRPDRGDRNRNVHAAHVVHRVRH